MDSDFVSEYRSLADPGDVTSSKKVEEAQLFKKILKTNTAQFKSDTDKALRRSVQAKKERERLKALRGGKGHTFLYSLTSAHSHRLEAVIFRNFIGSVVLWLCDEIQCPALFWVKTTDIKTMVEVDLLLVCFIRFIHSEGPGPGSANFDPNADFG
ncbi:unnamed protein product [Durusdinium trenchii]|uniref:Uncharacterized protein n=1 Tax=Durusdinium trenchii TaxID=1381693 RepID=A0ABP0LZ87_9DINO